MMAAGELLDSWASIYANSALLRSAIAFAHVGGLLIGGGFAIRADVDLLAALGAGVERWHQELDRLAGVHRAVIGSLLIVSVSGLLLALADVEAYLQSAVFWSKMALVVALVVNGAVLVRATRQVAAGDLGPLWRLRAVSIVSLTLWLTTTLLGVVLPNAI